ncbi:MAG: ABC transporter permease subunit [Nitrospinae bacterium]|nr:ABC transporter permease subunit [Nitrospinota bacterium]
MRFKRMLLIEAEKLFKAPVFWVAPLVAILYLALMLVGFEVYAAKNGVTAAEAASMNNRYSGSAVVYAYSAAKHMVENVLHLSREAKGTILQPTAEEDLPVEERTIKGGGGKRFDFFGTLLHSLANPKPMPSSPCDRGNQPAAPATPPAADESFLPDFFLGTASAAEVLPPGPPEFRPEDSFMERLAQRIHWLADASSLEDKVIDRGRFNGLRFTYLSFFFAFIFIFPPLTAAVTTHVFALEFSRGTIKTALLMPVKRWQLLAAKMAVVAGYLLVAIFGFILLTLAVGCIFTGYGNLVLDSELLGFTGGNLMIKGDGAVMLFAAVAPVAVLSLMPIAAITAWLSLIKPEPAWVISISVIGYFIFYALGETPLFAEIRFLFPTSYMDGWGLLFRQSLSASLLITKLIVSGLITAGIMVKAVNKFSRQDIGA